MGISISDLSERAQVQVAKKLLAQEAERRARKPLPERTTGKAKYHNKPTERLTDSGKVLKFPSQKEARRYDALLARLKAGEIRDLKLQVDFTLQEAYTTPEGDRIRAIRYRADFVYMERDEKEEQIAGKLGFSCNAWKRVVEDAKGVRTDVFVMKKKLMREKLGIDVVEV